jgi:hypothetical protein
MVKDEEEKYLKDFLNFYLEVISNAELLWGDKINHELLLECTLAQYNHKDSWHYVNVLNSYTLKTLEKKKKKK